MKITLGKDNEPFFHPYYIIYGKYDEAHSYTDNYIYNRDKAIIYANRLAKENKHSDVKQYEVYGVDGLIHIAKV